MVVYPDGQILGTIGGGELENRVRREALDALKEGKPRLLSFQMTDPSRGDVGTCGGQVEVFVEPILPAQRIIIIGGGHVGKTVAHLAKWVGFRVAVSDDRTEFCTPEANPDADEFYPVTMSELPLHVAITPQTCLILTTRGSQVDVAGLPALLETPAGYIGIIGSRRRWTETRRQLNDAGVSEEQLNRIQSPIGLGIGAETPEEIAVSIMAEVLMLRGGGTGSQMKDPR
jgi:xanthine dehydrogenase accessory factor